MTIIIDGRKISRELIDEFEKKIEGLKIKLAIILVGKDEASNIYVKMKKKTCERIGIDVDLISYSSSIPENKLLHKIESMNADPEITGILIQLPLPKKFNTRKILNSITESKDVDGLSIVCLGKMFAGEKTIIPATPKGMIRLLEIYNISFAGKEVLIIGTSNLVGKPLGLLCVNRGATVTFANSKTKNIKRYSEKADIIMTATGVPKLVKEDMVKKGVVIIDIGISRTGGKITGDVDFENVKEKAAYITPVPGGAGPMTIAMLIENLLELKKNEN